MQSGVQQWTGYSDGTLRINGRCLDVTGPGLGAKAKVAACTGAATQKWAIRQVSANDFGAIANTGTGTVLTDPGNSTTNGTQLVMGPDRGDQSYPCGLLPPLHDRLTSAAWPSPYRAT